MIPVRSAVLYVRPAPLKRLKVAAGQFSVSSSYRRQSETRLRLELPYARAAAITRRSDARLAINAVNRSVTSVCGAVL